MFVVILSPVGSYFENGMEPVKIVVETEDVRAVRGGTGEAKCGGNYGASNRAGERAFARVVEKLLAHLNLVADVGLRFEVAYGCGEFGERVGIFVIDVSFAFGSHIDTIVEFAQMVVEPAELCGFGGDDRRAQLLPLALGSPTADGVLAHAYAFRKFLLQYAGL